MKEGGRAYLLEQGLGKVDLVGNGATVNLNLEDVCLLLAKLELLNLGVRDDANDVRVILDALELLVHLRREGREGERAGGHWRERKRGIIKCHQAGYDGEEGMEGGREGGREK